MDDRFGFDGQRRRQLRSGFDVISDLYRIANKLPDPCTDLNTLIIVTDVYIYIIRIY